MSISEALLPEFDQEMQATRRLLERVPSEKLDWKPHAKSMPLGRLATHLAELPGWAKVAIEQDEIDIGADFTPTILGSVQEMLDLFDKNAAAARETIAATSDATFAETWTMKHEGRPVFSAPRSGVIRSSVMNHIVHHRGQLTVYLRLNDVALPGTYGPSADDSGM